MKTWRKEVYARDNYECVKCGTHGGKLNAHHINSYDTYEDMRLSIENGATLCEQCHIDFHREYGFGNNSDYQFQEWLKGIPR